VGVDDRRIGVGGRRGTGVDGRFVGVGGRRIGVGVGGLAAASLSSCVTIPGSSVMW